MTKKTPQKILPDYKPSYRLYETASKMGIPVNFMDELIPSFIFYWEEQKTRRASWDITFLNHVKLQWGYKLKKDKETRNTPLTQNTEYESLPEVKLSSKESAKKAIEQMKRKSGLRCRST